MADEKYTIEQVRDIVESEGLGYAVEDYLDSRNIADPKLRDAWNRAETALRQIREMIDDGTPDDDDDD